MTHGPARPTGRFEFGALRDALIVVLVLVGVKQSLLPLTFLYAGPASTFAAMAVATWLLARRGLDWRQLGLRWPRSWLKTLGMTALTFVLFALTMELSEALADQFFQDRAASGRFDHVEGNLPAYLIIMFLVWTHSSFFEELLFRAFMINRLSEWLGNGRRADLIAVGLAALFFGYRHYYYQGMHGAMVTTMAGTTFGLLYLWFGRRNILPLVLVHGIVNSIGMTLRIFGATD